MKINILSPNNFFKDHCSYSFAYPIIKSINLIRESGVNIRFLYSAEKKIFDCDILIIDSRFSGKKNKKKFINFLQKNKKKNLKIIFADTADNSGQIQNNFLLFADAYWKGQILKNKKNYLKSHYGGRLFTDFYKKKFNIIDTKKQLSDKVSNKNLLKKIKVCWNMGLCDHGYLSHYKQKLFSIFKLKIFINNSNKFFLPSNKRENPISCRIGTTYERKTIKFQREKISKVIKNLTETTKLNRYKYLNEIKNSKCVISPFGWGELCPRDFETFLNGAVLIKPNMETIDTWPNWYKVNQTYIPFDWDLTNLEQKIENTIKNYENFKNIAFDAQKTYLLYTTKSDSEEIFANRFLKLIKK
ncbi:MAG: hypothetical protein CFH26_00110 [Alphaproteobacteria bacterium MarineAlpha6_Bin4]|nr:MAG: hypothetical protein CFH25_00574 [Alphaproteobacteria bacterium MarineAlpha6_Bin3]PPR38382.1 MAG: hypothetical protein CFH26_00110 [Alphaproteobacteria bacterium MarineAlpha6_Bin4]|tara:strand:- start:23572 stop:24642 length:1071 start_codon:yes stop_codon:yes gene_type:complete